MADDILGQIRQENEFSFAEHTTYGCGGVAKRAYFPADEAEGCRIFAALRESGEKFYILGGGSDVLAQDGVYDGCLICTTSLKEIRADENGTRLKVGAGVTVGELMAYCKKHGCSGLEFLAGIPATVGGLAYMNGGAGGKFMDDVVCSVRLFDGKLRDLSPKECNFTYKHSTMRDINCLILSVELAVEHKNPADVCAETESRLRSRSALPSGRSCGCVFENYCGVSAGRIIENAGLKGVSCGKAYVSEEHADFIINGGTSSADVYRLIQRVKREVYKKFGINLKEEVNYIGEFDESDG